MFGGTKSVAEMLSGIGALRLAATSAKTATTTISNKAAEAFLIKAGIPAQLAPEFVASFSGQITARIIQKGESFLRFSSNAGGKGSFVTKSSFPSPSAAVEGLFLKPFGNTATFVQQVTAQRATVILEGSIKNSTSNASQAFLVDQTAFQFGKGVTF